LKELEETDYWLELLTDAGCVKVTRMAPLIEECRELNAIFTTIHKRTKKNLGD